MIRRRTISERRWPSVPEFNQLADNWSQNASAMLLGYVWQGCDAFTQEVLKPIGGARDSDRSLERSINSKLAPRIQRVVPKECPFYFQHKPDEFETQKPDPAQPPEPDFGFVPWANERLIWAIEAKVLRTDRTVSEYVREVRDNFLTCRYGPFSREGGMLGYLLEGPPSNAFCNIAKKIPCELQDHPEFPQRNHKTSDHTRKVPKGSNYSVAFRCHHMILEIGS